MPIEITIPRLGWSMDEGTFGEWMKADGDFVAAGEPVFTLESEKALQEVESVDAGILHIVPGGPEEGDTVTVGTLIAWLLEEGEAIPSRADSGSAIADGTNQKPIEADSSVAPAASPSVRRLAREVGVDLQDIDASGRIAEEDVRRAAGANASRSLTGATVSSANSSVAYVQMRPENIPDRNANPELQKISPRAARLAKQLGIDWTALESSGVGGRIREQDVRAAAATSKATANGHSAKSVRRVIAQRMLHSIHNSAPVTLTSRADATNLVSLRNQFRKSDAARVPAYHDIIARLVALTLRTHPDMNSQWVDGTIVEPDGIHVGLAVDTEAGLLVPVVRNCDQLSLRELTAHSSDLIERARQRKCSADELSGGTFSITNLGAFGIDAFTPIINSPETAILGLGAIRREAVVLEDDRIMPRDQITLSLTFDHQVVDGAPAARFLQAVVQAIENPAGRLID